MSPPLVSFATLSALSTPTPAPLQASMWPPMRRPGRMGQRQWQRTGRPAPATEQGETGAHLRVLTALPAHVSLTPRVADSRSVGSLVVPARPALRLPDAPDAVAGCTENGVSGASRPAPGPPTTCP